VNSEQKSKKNILNLMILDKTTGKPVPGLTSYPTWPQAALENIVDPTVTS